MAILAGLVLWRVQAQVSITGWVQHSNDVMLQARKAEIEFRKMQVNIRSFLLSPKEQYRSNTRDAEKGFTNSLTKMSALVIDNPAEERRVREISELKDQWMGLLSTIIANTNPSRSDESMLDAIEPLGGKIQTTLEQIIDAEHQLLEQRSASERRQDRLLFVLVPLLSLIVGVFLSAWGWSEIRRASNRYVAALDSAEEAARLKDNFIATVSHELRNPLNSIVLWCRTLSAEASSEKWRRGLAAMDRAAKAQAQLIDDLLDISRVGQGQLRLEIQNTDLVEVIRAAVETMRPAAEAKSIALQEILDPHIDFVAGDPARLQQIVWNLVSNAVKFTPRGGKVQVRLARIDSHVEIAVTDTGKGMESSTLPHVFERFWQAPGPLGNEPGVGLGLAIVKELVNLHGGTVIARSDGLGKGSTFIVRLPLPIADAALEA